MKKTALLFCTLAYLLIGALAVNAQWQQTGFNGRPVTEFAVSGTNIFAVVNGYQVFLSQDSGTNWKEADSGLPPYSNTYIVSYNISLAVSGTNIFAAVADGINTGNGNIYTRELFLSTDSGSSWMTVNNGLPGGNSHEPLGYSLAVIGTNIFVATGQSGIYLSTDMGANWSSVNNGLLNNVWLLYANGTNIVAETNNGLYLSTDTGRKWTSVNNGLTDSSQVLSLAMSGMNIFAGTNYDGVFLSTNNGGNWTAVNNGLPDSSQVISLVIKGANIFAGTYFNGVFLSANNGASWKAVNNGLTDLTVWDLAISGTDIFAGTDSGAWKHSLSDILAVENIKAVNNDFTIYPNPATNQLTIHTSLKDEHATVSIMNVLGQEASPPAPLSRKIGTGAGVGEDAVIDPVGYSSYGIDVSRLAAGIYFVQLKWESGSVVKKFVKE